MGLGFPSGPGFLLALWPLPQTVTPDSPATESPRDLCPPPWSQSQDARQRMREGDEGEVWGEAREVSPLQPMGGIETHREARADSGVT